MRSAAVALVVVLTACQAGGLEIIVYPPADPGAKKIDEIRIYVGLGAGQVTRMGTLGFAPDHGRRGGLWARDLDADALPYQSKKLSSDTESAAFIYAARTDGEQLSVIALGLTQGEVTSAIGAFELAVPSDYLAVHRIGLNAAEKADPNATAMTQVELWGKPDAETCVQLVDRGGYHDERYPISYITTPNDADCDGFVAEAADECDDHVYNSSLKPSTSTLSCLNGDTLVTSMAAVEACRVGGPSCVDGAPASTHAACSVAHPYCAPTNLCKTCNKVDFDRPFEECAIDPAVNDPTSTASYLCSVPTAVSAPGTTTICPHTLSIPLFLTNAATSRCANPRFHGPDKADGWRDALDVADGTYTLTSHMESATACAVDLTPTTLPIAAKFTSAYGGLLALDLLESRGIAVPIVLEADVPTIACDAATVKVNCRSMSSLATQDVRNCLLVAPSSPGI